MRKNKSGFTLTELVLTVGIIAVIFSVTAPIYTNIVSRNNLSIYTYSIALKARRANILSRTMYHDSSWGVKILSDKVVIFKGESYTTRDTVYDEVMEYSYLTPSGIDEIVFSKYYSIPNTTGDITLESINGEQSTISINSEGMIHY
jgi:prepilin-type N-terminal cleavage/methylation domain-containing protein